MAELFKNDEKEVKMFNSGQTLLDLISDELDAFFADVYSTYPLAAMLYDEARVPIIGVIKKDVFLTCFRELFASWAFAGTFESYIDFFEKVFGPTVVVDFTVPGPGELQIDITTSGVQLDNFIAREIVSNAYVFSNVVTQDDDQIVFQSVKGFQTTSELQAAVTTTTPNGIYTTVSLTIDV